MNEDRLRRAVAVANVPTLLCVLVQLTGETRWLEDPFLPTRNRGLGDNTSGGLPEDVQAEVRAAAADAIVAWQRGEPVALPHPPQELLVRMLAVAMGEEVTPEYGSMIASELELGEPGAEHQAPLDVPDGFRVLVVGAGMSGIAAGVLLGLAGVPYTVLERRDTVGGVWLENRYPGAGVDTPSALYSYSFAPHEWTKHFALRDELHDYLESVADRFGVRERIRLGTEVLAAAYDEDAQGWTVEARAPDGSTETLRANVLVTAVGGFNKPRMPDVPGLESFEGDLLHTARWPDDLDLTGKRLAVIGNGASAMQLVPAAAGTAGHVDVFQRSPQWAAPFELFHVDVPPELRELAAAVPVYRVWYRLRAGWTFNDRLYDSLQKDPDWEHPDRSLNKLNDAIRRFFVQYIESELEGRPDLIAKATPGYPPYGKRILLDNGWYASLRRDDVELITDAIAEVRADRVVTEAGTEHPVDVIACATGFDVVRFLVPMEVRGRGGVRLHDVWGDEDARAYLGTAVPGFPNFFMLYGPNTQGGHGGSLIGTVEAQLHYLMDVLRQLFEQDIGALEVRQDVHDAYNARVDEAHGRMVWTHPGMTTYYRNSRGRVVVPIPWRVVDFWHMTRHADLAEYITEPAAEPARAS